MAKRKLHVVPYTNGWAVRREGNTKASKVFDTKNEAIEAARNMAWTDDEDVIIHNKHGQISGKRYGKNPDDDSCFITTACVKYYGLDDDCYQLSTLRNFRDSYLKTTPEGTSLIKQYYFVAPRLVSLLNDHPNKNVLFSQIFEEINLACELIQQSKREEAKDLYINTVRNLLTLFQLKYGS
jgi:hypothetical protein